MAIDLREGSPYLNQAVCTCQDGGGYQGMSPECCATETPAPTNPPSTQPAAQSSGSSGGPPVGGGTETTEAADDEPGTVDAVVVTETEEPNWLDRDTLIDDVENKWIVGGGSVLSSILSCFCLMFLLILVR